MSDGFMDGDFAEEAGAIGIADDTIESAGESDAWRNGKAHAARKRQ